MACLCVNSYEELFPYIHTLAITAATEGTIHQLYNNLFQLINYMHLHMKCEVHCQSTVPSCLGLGGRSVRQIVSAHTKVAMNTITDVVYKRDADKSLCACSLQMWTHIDSGLVCYTAQGAILHLCPSLCVADLVQAPLNIVIRAIHNHTVNVPCQHMTTKSTRVTLTKHVTMSVYIVSPCPHTPMHIRCPLCKECGEC